MGDNCNVLKTDKAPCMIYFIAIHYEAQISAMQIIMNFTNMTAFYNNIRTDESMIHLILIMSCCCVQLENLVALFLIQFKSRYIFQTNIKYHWTVWSHPWSSWSRCKTFWECQLPPDIKKESQELELIIIFRKRLIIYC